MNFANIHVPYVDQEEIKKFADSFRKKYWDDTIPVDIERIVDFKMGIDIVPTANLEYQCDTDAIITSNWKLIYVDQRCYMDDRYLGRIRFSLAHEIGHYVLHRKLYELFEIKDLKDYYRLIQALPEKQYDRVEIQARIFASFLLIPQEILVKEKERIFSENDLSDFDFSDELLVNSYIAGQLARKFGVSPEAAERALGYLEKK